MNKEILNNTTVDLLNNKDSVKCLYEEDKLANLGENLFCVTKRVTALHNKIYPKQEIAEEMDLYINEKVHNENYIPIHITEACQENH